MKTHRSSYMALLGATLIVASSCQTRNFGDSTPKEQFTADNSPTRLGVSSTVSFDEVKALTAGEATKPWSDTYWPLMYRGVANRWITSDNSITLSDQMTSFADALDTKDENKLAILSPAEKWEAIVHGSKRLSASLLTQLKGVNIDENAEIKDARTKMQEVYKQIDALGDEMRERTKKILALAEDSPERKALEKEQSDATDKMQNLYKDYDSIRKTLEDLQTKLKKDNAKKLVGLSDQVASTYPLVGSSWETFSRYSATFDGNWGWMGHCHGWAPASLMEETPKHSVVVKKDGMDILFTEGDIRGLLTKVWADQGPASRFASGRCASSEFETDARNRILDGKICYGETGEKCLKNPNSKIMHVQNKSFLSGNQNQPVWVFTETLRGKNPLIAVTTQSLGDDQYKVIVFSKTEFVNANGDLSKVQKREAVLHDMLACRDTNAGLFHIALTKLINQKKEGFVFDRTRTDEVWNQPVYKYELKYLPIKKKDKTMSVAGEPVSKDDVRDVFRIYRAPNYQFLVQVQAEVFYGKEKGPLASYQPKDNISVSETYVYTLELDKDRNIIGGEWGPIPTESAAHQNQEDLDYIGGDSPDFIWLFPQGSKPRRGDIDYAMLKKIHACSLEPATGKKSYKVNGRDLTLDVSECQL